jgi:hypothetical protein
MADGSVRTPGSGETIASDDIGGVKWQRMKIGVGSDGAATDMKEPADGIQTGVLPAGTLLYDDTASSWVKARSARTVGDADAGATSVPASSLRWNGTTFDRERGNTEGTLLASAARTVQAISATQTNYNARGVILFFWATVDPGGGRTIQISLQYTDPVSGTHLIGADFAATTGTQQVLHTYPGVTPVASGVHQALSRPLPRTWRAVVTPSDAASWTYSLGYSLVL